MNFHFIHFVSLKVNIMHVYKTFKNKVMWVWTWSVWLLSVVLIVLCCDGAAGVSVPLQACRGQQGARLPRVYQQKEPNMWAAAAAAALENMATPVRAARLCLLAGRRVTSLSVRHRRAVCLPQRRCYISSSTGNSEWMCFLTEGN